MSALLLFLFFGGSVNLGFQLSSKERKLYYYDRCKKKKEKAPLFFNFIFFTRFYPHFLEHIFEHQNNTHTHRRFLRRHVGWTPVRAASHAQGTFFFLSFFLRRFRRRLCRASSSSSSFKSQRRLDVGEDDVLLFIIIIIIIIR